MTTQSNAHRLVIGLFLIGGLTLTTPMASAQAKPIEGSLFYTRYSGSGANVKAVDFSFNGSTFSLGSPVPIATTPGADGILFAPDGDLVVGGQADAVYKINPMTGDIVGVTGGGVGVYHVILDPDRLRVWGGGIPGGLSEIPLNPFANGTARPLTGDNPRITHLAFTPGGAVFYTSSFPGGFGSFGLIDLNTFTTTRLISNLPAAHGMSYDTYTGHLLLFGSNHITQIDPENPTAIVSDRSVNGVQFDQGAVTGEGHVLVASNINGLLFFMDYSESGLVADPGNFVALPYLDSNLDDVAPLVGLGSPCQLLDFETEDDYVTLLVNGQDISSPPEFGNLVSISASTASLGPAIFDTDPLGPNQFPLSKDPDLLVGLGNALIFQGVPGQTTPGIFDTPDDFFAGGTFFFDFASPVELLSVDLVDIDIYKARQDAFVTLVDDNQNTRVFHAPSGFTEDVALDGPPGFRTLDLTTLDPQAGYVAVATASEDPGFEATNVVRLEIFLASSGAVDNLKWCSRALGSGSSPIKKVRLKTSGSLPTVNPEGR